MITFLLIVHGLLAVTLLGAVTHQAFSVVKRPAVAGGPTQRNFVDRFRGVSGASYTNAIVILFVITMILGDVVYAPYRVDIRPVLEDLQMRAANGIFELKEHVIAIGMLMLPAYWLFWRQPLTAEFATARKYMTITLAVIVWYGFLIGHIINNIKGFGQP